jgi:hypothetical protein
MIGEPAVPRRVPLLRVPPGAAAAAWILVGIAASVHVIVSPEHHNLWPVFRAGAQNWWNGSNIYAGAHYFTYSPAFAVLLAPLAVLPGVLGNILFDLGGLALLFHATRQLMRRVFPELVLSRYEPAVLLLSLPPVVRSVWSSQAHTWTAALIFLAAVALGEQRWWAAAFCLALAVHLKLSPVVLAGVVAVIWPRVMSWRLPAALGAWALLPVVRGDPGQAMTMYGQWVQRLQVQASRRYPSFRDVRHVFEVVNAQVPVMAYIALQVVAGLGVLVWAWRLQRRGLKNVWLVSGIFALTIAYMLLFGPAVEFVQYPLLAPWISAAFVAAWPRPGPRLALGSIFVLTMITSIGAVEDVLGAALHSPVPEMLITLGTLAFGAWVVLAWQDAPGQARDKLNRVLWLRSP